MKKDLKLQSDEEAGVLFGSHDQNLKLIEKELGVKIVGRGENLILEGNAHRLRQAERLIGELLRLIRQGGGIRKQDVLYAARTIAVDKDLDLSSIYLDRIEIFSKRQFVTPRTKGQKVYVDAIRDYDIVFAIGPAGTGKSYLAMAMAVDALKRQEVSRIILTRPAVEAGESLGYLPGDMYEKVTPYLRPLYDALYDMMEVERVQRYLSEGVIEIAPLAYMRGRTLNNSFIILDEAQNATPEQVKMFLTRLGFDSKTVITGDITQSDLPGGKARGLLEAEALLKEIEGIKFIYFTGRDVVRHELVQKIIAAYEKKDK